MATYDDKVLADLLDIIILNEFLRKDLLILIQAYVKNFGGSFDYSRPIAYIDFENSIRQNIHQSLMLKQFLLNLETFIIKLYKIGEADKDNLKNTKLKSLRQSFAHRRSSDILSNKERMVIFAGLMFNLDVVYVANLSDEGKDSKHIEYPYAAYIELLLSNLGDDFRNKKDNVKQLRKLNADILLKLFPHLPQI